ncbi:hypothetical protein AB0A63_09745 [Lentzea sp. NPDC042327]|uniref:hypothetical protein n=1 Tax=Lentzea sp. NPDC042327 TaxID=3154801 RepID=UPI0033C73E3A
MTNTRTNNSATRALLWTALVFFLIGNVGSQVLGLGIAVTIAFGVLTLLAGAALVAGRRR